MKKKFFAYPYVLWAIVFTVIPLFMVLWYSVVDTSGGSLRFSFEFFKKCFEPLYFSIIVYSFKIAFICTVLCLVIGYPAAFILAGKTFKRKSLFLFLLMAPMWMNFLLRTYAWLTILEPNGVLDVILGFFGIDAPMFLYTEGAVILGIVYNFLPFMILPIHTALSKMDKSLIEASGDLGAGAFQTFLRVRLPLSLPGVFSGIAMVFMPAVTTFVITRLLGGSKYIMIGNVIEDEFIVTGNWSFASALSALLMIIILLIMKFTKKYEAEGGGLM